MTKKKLLMLCAIVVPIFFNVTAHCANYFISASNGSDVNPGTIEKPWRTFAHAQMLVSGGDTIYLSTGKYEMYSETIPMNRSETVTYQALPGHVPTISGINISYPSTSKANLFFKGFVIFSDSIANIINIGNAEGVAIVDCKINAPRWYLDSTNVFTGINIFNASDVSVKNTYFREVGLGIRILASKNISIDHNYIRVKGGSGIQYLGNSTNIIIENNHIHGEEYTPYPEDPLAMKDVHQSIISIRGDNIIIRDNIMHSMANGIMTYTRSAVGGEDSYDNIVLENNVVFKIDSGFAVRFYSLGNDILVNNNLFFSGMRKGSCVDGSSEDARYRYFTALAVHSLAPNNVGSGLSLYNNIFIGSVFIPKTVIETNNIYWSLSDYDLFSWKETSTSNTSKVLVNSYLGCGGAPKLFEDTSFFKLPLNLSSSNFNEINFLLAEKSLAKNFGNTFVQAKKSLGSIGSDGFIMYNGIIRNNVIHSAGPYETYFNLKSPENFIRID